MTAYAEVIGDPIAHSKSPIIHRHWLEDTGVAGDYVRTRVEADDLSSFLAGRRNDPNWRGCNVTIPHKERVLALLDAVDERASAIGAVNCVVPEAAGLRGYNTDVDGVAAALETVDLAGRSAILIGAGGGARAAVAYLAGRGIGDLVVLVRDPDKAGSLRALAPEADMRVEAIDGDIPLPQSPAVVINASPLGMTAKPAMPRALLAKLVTLGPGTTVFDMVYDPLDTDLLKAERAAGAHAVDGLVMLVAQAARAFELFFGVRAPPADDRLRYLLRTA